MSNFKEILCGINFTIKIESIQNIEIDFQCSKFFFETNYNTIITNLISENTISKWDLECVSESIFINQKNHINFDINKYELENNIEFNLKIFKYNFLHIFNENKILSYFKSQKIENILKELGALSKEKFYINESTFQFSNNINIKINSNCYFFNVLSINANPYFFDEVLVNVKLKSLKNYLLSIRNLMSIINLANISSINDDDLFFKVIGHKSFEYKYKSIESFSKVNIYFKIYKWVYENERLIDDRILIFRNLVTFYLKKSSIDVVDSIYDSLLANNENYIKGNIEKYFEIRKSILNEIDNYSKVLQSSISTFSDNFQKNIILIITFFISLYLTKVFENETKLAEFSSKMLLIGLLMLVFSIIYYFFSIKILKLEENNIKEKYKRLKNRYENITNEIDLNNFLTENNEFDIEIRYFNTKKVLLNVLWILCIIIMSLLLLISFSL